MATTTNYSWSTPDDTDLVKDGAAAIRTLGSSIDTTTKALNPSTTLGDIEYRSATADTNTRLGIGSTGDVLTVAGGVPTWAAAAGGGPTLVDYTPTFTNFTLGNGTAITKWYDASDTMFYIYIALTYGSTSVQTSALRISTPATQAGNADAAVAGQMILGKFVDVSAGKDYPCYAAGGTTTTLQLFSYDVSTSPARNGNVNDTTPVAPATGDQFFIQGWLRKA